MDEEEILAFLGREDVKQKLAEWFCTYVDMGDSGTISVAPDSVSDYYETCLINDRDEYGNEFDADVVLSRQTVGYLMAEKPALAFLSILHVLVDKDDIVYSSGPDEYYGLLQEVLANDF